MNILLLVESLQTADISHALYANALRALGHDVYAGNVNSIGTHNGAYTVENGRIYDDAKPYAPIPCEPRLTNIDPDLVWLLNQPHEQLARDLWQILWRWNQETPFINDVTGLHMLNNKNNLPLLVPDAHLPNCMSGSDPDVLINTIQERCDSTWVLKGANGGCGADVYILRPDDSNVRPLVQSMTGNAKAGSGIAPSGLLGLQARYALLQQHVPHTSEKRVAVVANEIASAQEKKLQDGDHRGNVTQDASMNICTVTQQETDLALEIGAQLQRYGILFAGIDMAFPYVFEVNLVNPGGLVERFQKGEHWDYLQPMLDRLVTAAAPTSPEVF
ncbi:ATP-grasp domain-containing protein [Actinopolyspora sp. H202]|uniref:ATP-grasp domain-containing protein n=1 Tax=Actinopolyspora sp. H202 TaxID=1500456 RepID=UPI003EE52F09